MVRACLKKAACILVLSGMLIAGQMTAYGDSGAEGNPSVYVTGTEINGVNVSGLTPQEAKSHMEEFLTQSYELLIIDSSQRETTISHGDISLGASVKGGLEEVLAQENAEGRLSGPSVDNSFSVEMEITYDESALEEKLKNMPCLTSGVTATKDASISPYEEGKEFTIIPEVRGNSVNWDKLLAAVKEAIASGQRTLNIYEAGCYDTVQVTEDSQELKELCDKMNQLRTMTVTYVFGEEKEVLDGSVLASWIQGTADGLPVIDRDKAAAYVAALADKYDTAGKTRTFYTASGRDVQVTGPYGWKIDREKETEALIAAVQTGESSEREPLYSQTGADRGTAEWGGTYVEIDLTGQHVYAYKDGVLAVETPCVTGNVSKGWTTPPGIFGLYYKQRDRVLRGEDYETPVSYWMPFNGGIGLHDANWRGQFGGTIYQKSGSHGCVNLPPAKAAQIYDIVYKGMPVICYN